MKKIILTMLYMVVSMVALTAGPLSGRRVPSFSLPDSNATYHDILDYRGKVVLVEVMQTTCSHCQELAGQLEKVQEKYGEKVQILSLVVPPDNAESVKQFSVRFHIRYPILFDCGQAAASLLKVTPANPKVTFPHLFLVDKSGMIREDYEWEKDQAFLSGQGLIQSIDKLLAGAPAAPAKAAVTSGRR